MKRMIISDTMIRPLDKGDPEVRRFILKQLGNAYQCIVRRGDDSLIDEANDTIIDLGGSVGPGFSERFDRMTIPQMHNVFRELRKICKRCKDDDE